MPNRQPISRQSATSAPENSLSISGSSGLGLSPSSDSPHAEYTSASRTSSGS